MLFQLLCGVCVAASVVAVPVAGPTCRDGNDKPVDWFVMYKFPVITGASSPTIRAGLGYAYMDANNLQLTASLGSVNDTMNPLYYTLQQIYTSISTSYIMYNDESAVTGVSSSTFGHSKGAAAWGIAGGFWLLHSVPAWPPAGNTSYSYAAKNAPTYAQTFLCTSLNASNLNVVFDQWAWTRPGVYSSFMDGYLNASFPGAAAVLAGKRVTAEPWTNVANVFTNGGLEFTYFAKYTNWRKELYEDLVSPTLGVNLNTATWQNGVGSIPSSCAPNYTWNVQNIAGIVIADNLTWVNSKDHAKWAIADSCSSPRSSLWICIGDINRQEGQLSRAGGTMCTRQYEIYSAFQKTITGFKINCTTGDVCELTRAPTTSPTSGSSQASILMALSITILLFVSL